MKISYLISCHNETRELLELTEKLNTHLKSNASNDEVVILDDFSDNEDTKNILENARGYGFSIVQHALNKNFAEHKNYGSKRCVGDYIVQLDADEYLWPELLQNMQELITSNPQVELYRVPRVNIVRGCTPQDAAMWGWHLSTLPKYFGNEQIINWNHGDYQSRIYKNSQKIQWKKPLHETIEGAEYVATLPKEVEWAIIHDKTIQRQLSQNKFYNQNWSKQANMGQG
jgi:glycosyltransferase involved in cell wall biosynthesis